MKQVKAFCGNGKQIDQSFTLMDQLIKALMITWTVLMVNGQNLDWWVITFCIMAMELFLAHPWLCPLELPNMEVNLEHSYWKRRMVKNSIIAESFLILLFLFTNMFFKAAQRLHWVSKTTIIKCILLRLVRGTYANSAVLALYCRFGLQIGILNSYKSRVM